MIDWEGPLTAAYERATRYLNELPERRVGPRATAGELHDALGGPLPTDPTDPLEVIADLADGVDGGLLPSGSGRFFGFVFGGATPASLAADWLTSTWDQNAGLYAASPAAAVVEDVTARWLVELFGLPGGTSVGFVTGAQMANFTALAAARHEVLRNAGWDVERDGLIGAPPIRVLAGAERHDTIDRALRFLGLGTNCIVPVAVDEQGRMLTDALAEALRDDAAWRGTRGGGVIPTIVCAQVGNVNTGAFDPVRTICDLAHQHQAWVHVDGAFGLWASVSQQLSPLLDGIELADSWATDAHKWLNVPYDSGIVLCAHPEAHRAAMSIRAAYLIQDEAGERDPLDYNPEFSRRARGIPVYAAVRALGRTGIAEIVDRCHAMANRFADALRADGVEVLNEVVLNQVLVRFGDDDAVTRRVVAEVQDEGTCWMSGTTWHGKAAMRISVTNWTTGPDDIDRSAETILKIFRKVS
ncbi:pyridoxal phosphate-dependent decarboxylase family protein [Kribbella shirazensis]|uniref:Glutamate/tyrosine decarboxylase-like PLP-dependent enzyme n=1 Tax=Kribbella shirazensis TaxID=1105143 RepID=A0A7X5ZYQ9_9ACTN|nr:pyridoxal-dependent decarboxylase [Kribbella shirazensis]NIK54349.1 glutamate/tyrosine decarboxylase-like PLP-dependent enzyme [Kribbella shirazensis]